MMSSNNLQINDPVHITSTSKKDGDTTTEVLEGIVAHLGPVQFAPGSDWIGIRLTGQSIGKGKNDGSVKGIQYFNVGTTSLDPNQRAHNGMFVRKSNVTKRTDMSRLDMIRLRRELEKDPVTAIGSSSVGGSDDNKKSPIPKTTAAAASGTTRVYNSSKSNTMKKPRKALKRHCSCC